MSLFLARVFVKPFPESMLIIDPVWGDRFPMTRAPLRLNRPCLQATTPAKKHDILFRVDVFYHIPCASFLSTILSTTKHHANLGRHKSVSVRTFPKNFTLDHVALLTTPTKTINVNSTQYPSRTRTSATVAQNCIILRGLWLRPSIAKLG